MSRLSLRTLKRLLALALLVGCLPAAVAASAPTLFSITSGKAEVLAQGAQKSWPIKLSENSAFDAVFEGGMWLPNPAGGRIYAKYQRHIIHPNGTWTWIGTVSTVHGEQSVVLTFGKDGVFGLIPQASGHPLRIVSRVGQTRVVETSAEGMARSTQALRLRSKPDFMIPPRVKPVGDQNSVSQARAAEMAVQAKSSGTATIDVMVAYTSGFVAELGSVNLALIRIQNLVDITNTAYFNSDVNQQIRLVHTVEVDYPDNTSNSSALDDITGLDADGYPVPIPDSLQGIAALRTQYGADLVSLIRGYDNATQGGCGIGWLIGGNEQTIVPGQDNVYGYNLVSDGSNGGYYCLDTTFAHELGHNMGDAHDRANAADSGAYSYSYGYVHTGTNAFSTIMAYDTTSDTPLAVFSNPNISICENSPCGVADGASNSADNVHSMNNTAALIAQFEPTMVGAPPPPRTAKNNDIDGDGLSDLLWYSQNLHQMTYWLMDGASRTSWRGFPVPSGYQPVTTRDFDGNGEADILWTDGKNNLYMWLNNGEGAFTSQFVTHYSGKFTIAGAADVNLDGECDIFWYNKVTGQLTYWLMNGSTMQSWRGFTVSNRFWPVGFGDFDGDGRADVLWSDANGNLYMWLNDGKGGFTRHHYVTRYNFRNFQVAGVADVDGDGKFDILWYSKTLDKFTYWLMDGATMRSWRGFAVPSTYRPVGTGDYDGDGRADILWNTPQNDLYMWLDDGNGGFNPHLIVHYSTNFVPVN